MKALAVTTGAGIEIVSSFSVGQAVVGATVAEEAQTLGAFLVSMNAGARLEIVASVPFGGSGILILYDATPGAIPNREVFRMTFANTSEAVRRSSVFELVAQKIYQIRAACTDPTPGDKVFLIESVQVIDS